MKLLYLSSPSFADCDFPLIRAFQEKGVDVTYLIMLPPFFLKSTLFNIKIQIPSTKIIVATEYDEFKSYSNYMDMTNVFIANRTSKSGYTLSYWKHKYDIYRFIKKGKFDVIHTDVMLSSGLSFVYRMGIKCVQTVHDPFPHTGEMTSRKRSVYRSVMENVKNFVILNNKQKDDFCRVYGIDSSKVFINHLGVYDNIRAFVNPEWKERQNNILFFGRISPYKGLEYLCEAMKKVHEIIPNATLTIAGGGKMYFDISSYEILDYVEVRNHFVDMEELAQLLMECSISVCPYTDATQSGVIMTSFSLCKPVIATNVGGLGEMIEDGKTGILVPPKNSDALSDAIIGLLSNNKMLSQMKRNIHDKYLYGEKSWNCIAEKYIDIYNTI